VKRVGHYLLGAVAGLGVAQSLGWPSQARAALHGWPAWTGGVAGVGVAVLAGGLAATVAPWPDMDQRRWWTHRRDALTGQRTIRRDLPRALQHRRLTHWWGLAVPAGAPIPLAPAPLSWLLAALVAGWLSHLAGDWVFGKRGPRETGWRGAGIPLAPCSRYHGLGLKCGGRIERYIAWPLCCIALVLQMAWVIVAQ